MKDLYIVFGSETKLLKELFLKSNVFFIRIYNNRVPSKLSNAVDVNSFENFKSEFENIFKKDKPKRVIFLGAAFLVQNNLLIMEKQSDLDSMLETNISSYVKYSRYLIPFMLKIKSGQFIFLSSFRAVTTARGISVYSASKAFCEKFFETIGIEYGSHGIYSTSIRLGCMEGRMIDVIQDDYKENLLKNVGSKRLGNSNDVLNTIDFILENNYVSGGVIDLTSGISF
jgi:NADP-dependent 3-hydroxy acid dehydrogenase YdfG